MAFSEFRVGAMKFWSRRVLPAKAEACRCPISGFSSRGTHLIPVRTRKWLPVPFMSCLVYYHTRLDNCSSWLHRAMSNENIVEVLLSRCSSRIQMGCPLAHHASFG
jgi:hypothetical protein